MKKLFPALFFSIVFIASLLAFILYPEYNYRKRVEQWQIEVWNIFSPKIEKTSCVKYSTNGFRYPPYAHDVWQQILEKQGFKIYSKKFFGFGFDFVWNKNNEQISECLNLDTEPLSFFTNSKEHQTYSGKIYSWLFDKR